MELDKEVIYVKHYQENVEFKNKIYTETV